MINHKLILLSHMRYLDLHWDCIINSLTDDECNQIVNTKVFKTNKNALFTIVELIDYANAFLKNYNSNFTKHLKLEWIEDEESGNIDYEEPTLEKLIETSLAILKAELPNTNFTKIHYD